MNHHEQFIVIYGNPADGFSHVGPFDSHDEASTYTATDEPANWWIVRLDAPAYAADDSRSNGPHQTQGA
jgi:hypothetical protein